MSKPAKAPLHATLKAVPKFASESAERVYWESHDSSEHLDWSQAQTVSLPNLKPTTKTISLRLPQQQVTGKAANLRAEGQRVGAYKSTEADALRRVKALAKNR